MTRWILTIVVLACSVPAARCCAQRPVSFGSRPDGSAVTVLAPASAKAVVLYFVASDCPVSNRTMPEMLRVRDRFGARGVAFWFVYPNHGETAQRVRRHQAAFGAGNAVILDPQGTLVALTQARVTPEAAVLVPAGSSWKPVYVGRVDDRYVRLGLERPQATEHFVEQVVDEVLRGATVQAAVGTPVGCAIVNPQAPLTDSEAAKGSVRR